MRIYTYIKQYRFWGLSLIGEQEEGGGGRRDRTGLGGGEIVIERKNFIIYLYFYLGNAIARQINRASYTDTQTP